jgi:hypothetical protein
MIQKSEMNRKSALLPAWLLILASLIFIYIGSSYIVSPDQVLRPVIILTLVLLILSWPAYWLTKNWDWTAIFLVIVVLGLFSSTLFAYAYSITIVSLLLVLWVIFKILKRKFGMRQVFIALNSVSIVAIVLALTVFYTRMSKVTSSYYSAASDAIRSRNYVDLDAAVNAKPDIYFIVLDGYGRADILKDMYGLDNSQFIGFLEQNGFTVSKDGLSNYPKTVLSIASMLNMDYIKTLVPASEDSVFWWLLSPYIDHSSVRNSLEKIGYTSVSISTDWDITDNPTTDHYIKSYPLRLSDFERFFLGITPLRMIEPPLSKVLPMATFESHRRGLQTNFSSLIESTKIPGPKFVFAHIILPHPPFVFSENGEALDPKYSYSFNDASDYPGSSDQYRQRYTGQVLFLNSQLEKVINSILENSKIPPIIILQADHGPGMNTDTGSAANTCLEERYSIFSAYYLPDNRKRVIPENTSSVNLFRSIFNEYFNANLPVLENVQYYPSQAERIYDLEDVSEKIAGRENCGPK